MSQYTHLNICLHILYEHKHESSLNLGSTLPRDKTHYLMQWASMRLYTEWTFHHLLTHANSFLTIKHQLCTSNKAQYACQWYPYQKNEHCIHAAALQHQTHAVPLLNRYFGTSLITLKQSHEHNKPTQWERLEECKAGREINKKPKQKIVHYWKLKKCAKSPSTFSN